MTPTGSALDITIGENLRILTKVMGDICLRSTLEEAGGGVTANQFAILKMLARDETLTTGDFARILGVSNAAVSKNIHRLVELGCVSRDAHPDDRRRVVILMQTVGCDLLARHETIARRKMKTILTHFDAGEKSHLLDMVQRLIWHTLSEQADVELICFQCGGHCGESCVVEQRQGTCSLDQKQGDRS